MYITAHDVFHSSLTSSEKEKKKKVEQSNAMHNSNGKFSLDSDKFRYADKNWYSI